MYNLTELLAIAIKASIEAGDAIMKVYDTDFTYVNKEDKSPLTLADTRSNEVINLHLTNLSYPILSEEGKSIAYEDRKNWKQFWLVDPLDGTKEFIKRNGEFTVNIAFVDGQNPVLGVIYVPATDVIYFGTMEIGAYVLHNVKTSDLNNLETIINQSSKLPYPKGDREFTVVASRSHNTPETEAFINKQKEKYPIVELISSGSSLKLCLVAEGAADVYPRLAPTMEWDTAAGQAIAQAAGKQVLDYKTGKPMLYNKENLLNEWFVVE